MPHYIGRFAPSPTGPLHAGSVVAALASWLDARAHGGTWLIRVEDVDEPRCKPEHGHTILQQLAALGLLSDAPVIWQTSRKSLYEKSLSKLKRSGAAYGCACSRKDIADALALAGMSKQRNGELVYPGTCRNSTPGKPVRAWRMACAPGAASFVQWHDRRLGPQQQQVDAEVGDFVLLRSDGYFAYQLAVVVDDAAQGITHVVRGEDLADNTARQILLQRSLGLPAPTYLHTPLVMGANGEKLSKQNGAQAVGTGNALATLQQAAAVLGLRDAHHTHLGEWLHQAVGQWRGLYNLAP
jgi:glutamyl-Q tRNA(Asp) synthetase